MSIFFFLYIVQKNSSHPFIHSLHDCISVLCLAPAIDTQWRSGKKEEWMKSSEPDPWLVSAGQWPVEGISPPLHRWVVPPSNRHMRRILRACCWLCWACCRGFLQITMSQTIPWFHLCRRFIYDLLQTPSRAIMYKLEICILYKRVKQWVDFSWWYFTISSFFFSFHTG